MKYLPIFLLSLLVGCSPPIEIDITYTDLRKQNGFEKPEWITEETAKRFPKAHVFINHGYVLFGKWATTNKAGFPVPVQYLADELVHRHPDRPIVLWICNHRGDLLYGDNVYYFTRPVWGMPDDKVKEKILEWKMWVVGRELERDFYSDGSIFEAVEAKFWVTNAN